MPFEFQIALRYLLGRRRQAFISIISLLSTLGVTVGVLALIVAMAMMTGLQSELRDRILGSTAHAFVFKTTGIQDYRAEIEALRKIPRIVGAAPALIGRAMASSRGARCVHQLQRHRAGARGDGHGHREVDGGGQARRI